MTLSKLCIIVLHCSCIRTCLQLLGVCCSTIMNSSSYAIASASVVLCNGILISLVYMHET